MSARSLKVKQLCCICCQMEGIEQVTPTQEHHLNAGGHAGQKRLGDDYSVPLCSWHHVGDPPQGMTAEEASYHYGPSLARTSKRFRQTYGDDAYLLMITNEQLEQL